MVMAVGFSDLRARPVGFRRGSDLVNAGAVRDIVVDYALPSDGDGLFFQASTGTYVAGPPGGGAFMTELKDDLTPQLGGNLDLNTFSIIAAGPTTISGTEVSYLDGTTGNIQDQLDALAVGLSWQGPVINLQTVPAVGPSDGDRYIVGTGGSGLWTAHDDEIATWDLAGGAWTFETPSEGWATWNETPDYYQVFTTGVGWVRLGKVISHDQLLDVSADDHHNQSHALAGGDHSADTFANLDGKVNDADLVKTALGETSVANEIPRFTGTAANDLEGSGVTVATGIAGGSLLSLVAFTTSDPVAPSDGDIWILSAGAQLWLKAQFGGATFAVELA